MSKHCLHFVETTLTHGKNGRDNKSLCEILLITLCGVRYEIWHWSNRSSLTTRKNTLVLWHQQLFMVHTTHSLTHSKHLVSRKTNLKLFYRFFDFGFVKCQGLLTVDLAKAVWKVISGIWWLNLRFDSSSNPNIDDTATSALVPTELALCPCFINPMKQNARIISLFYA